MELDYLKLRRMMGEQELLAFGPKPEEQIRQIERMPREAFVPLADFLHQPDCHGRLLHWLSWDASFLDAKRAYVAFHSAWQRILAGDPQHPIVPALQTMARDGASAEALILATIDAEEA